ncbi:MAG TPA: electron transfer flavoprotein subunit alpha/FixB family protein [Terriglobales bacterium]|jgi:electron transfer flavoprotein alpha subunit
MSTVLVITEQRDGKLNRVSFETIVAAQKIAADKGWMVQAVVIGGDIASAAAEVAAKKLEKVYQVTSSKLAQYTADGYAAALKSFLAQKPATLVLFPHTYQVRDFAPKLALSLERPLISDVIGYKSESGKLVFTRQMFQGKFAADVSFTGEPPYFVTVQAGSFRGDQAENGASAAPIETVNAALESSAVRVKPHDIYKEAKQAVDLTQAEIIVSVGRGIKEQKNLEMASKLAEALGGELAASRPICDAGWLPIERQIGSSGQTVSPKLYLALGISGAIQHLVGMKGSRSVIAINKDPEAPIFDVADIAVVGNLLEIVPALTEELKKAKAEA